MLTVASIVEREAVLDEERPLIAGVYLNRLARGMRLEADPTVQYAMGFQPDSGQWWKTPVYLEEYSQVISPYNTYLNAGLPPAPSPRRGWPASRPCSARPSTTTSTSWPSQAAPADTSSPAPSKSTWRTCGAIGGSEEWPGMVEGIRRAE